MSVCVTGEWDGFRGGCGFGLRGRLFWIQYVQVKFFIKKIPAEE